MKRYKNKRKAKMFIVPFIQNFRDYWDWLAEQEQQRIIEEAVRDVLQGYSPFNFAELGPY